MAQSAFVRPNPALTRGFARVTPGSGGAVMSLQGTVNKTLLLTIILVASGAVGWATENTTGAGLFYAALFGAFVIGLVTSFRPPLAAKTAPIYALLEGFALGSLSRLLNNSYPGIALTAAELTVGILLALLFIYSTGIIRVTQKFRIAVAAATVGIFITLAITMIANAFGATVGFVNGQSFYAIAFTLIVIGIACANLIVDFDMIQRNVAAQYPQEMEWYGAFAIMVSLVWLYIEVLRLLSQLNRR